MKLPWRDRSSDAGGKGKQPGFTLPDRQQPVTVAMPDGQRLPGRVADREQDELLVMLMVPIGEPLTDAQLRRIVLELSGSKGLVLLGGNATAEESDLLRFRDLHALDVLQRREYVRVKAARTVLVTIPGSYAPIESCSVDISGGGMLLGGLDHVNVGEQVSFRLTTDPDSPQIAGSGTVVRCDPGGHRAIAFDSISDGDRRRLIRFVFERQRSERSKGLLTEHSNGR